MKSTIRNWSRSEKLALIPWGLLGVLLLIIAAHKDQSREVRTVVLLGSVEKIPSPTMPQVLHSAISLMAPIDPRSKTPAIAGGNKGPAGGTSSGINGPVECSPKSQTCWTIMDDGAAQRWLDENGLAGTVKDNNTIVIDGVIDITHETSQAPNPEFRWI